jgi:hypothetical protein
LADERVDESVSCAALGAIHHPVDERPGGERDVAQRIREMQRAYCRPPDPLDVALALRLEVAPERP